MGTVGEVAALSNKVLDMWQSSSQNKKRRKTEAARHELNKALYEDVVYFIIDYFDVDGVLSEISEADKATKTNEANFIKHTHRKKRVSIDAEKLKNIVAYTLLLEQALEDM